MSSAFPLRIVIPEEPDPTERALFDAFAVAEEFHQAITRAQEPARLTQLRERLTAAATVLLKLESEASEREQALRRES